METKDDNKDLNNYICYCFYLYGNWPDNVDTCWYHFVNSNNGKIPEDELNYQKSKVHSNKKTSTMMKKKQARTSSHGESTMPWTIQARTSSHGELNY